VIEIFYDFPQSLQANDETDHDLLFPNIYLFSPSPSLMAGDHLRDPGVDMRIILKWI
jgi:hypothetical protein